MGSLATGSVVLFGDSSQDTGAAFTDLLLSGREQTNLSKLLALSLKALQEERLELPHVERAAIPSIEDLHCFRQARKHGRSLHPALRAAELTLLQLGSFVSAYEARPDAAYPSSADNLVVGICLGELAASAVALADSLTTLLPIAVLAVRTSFRIGHLASKISDELAGHGEFDRAWSILVSKDSELADSESLQALQHSLSIPSRKEAFISANATRTRTISAPPSTLDRILESVKDDGKTKPCEIPIYVPYHAPHLYSDAMVEGLFGGLLPADSTTTPQRSETFHYVSGHDGRSISASSLRSTLVQAAKNVLQCPLDFETSLQKCSENVAATGVQDWRILPFGPSSSAQKLTALLKTNQKISVDLDADFWRPADVASSSKAPLAIVGMAGRFPQASNHDRLWELLMDGRDVHQEIPESRFDPETHLSSQAYGCFIENPGNFDARFFNMSPREALQTDPGQRLAMATAYEALEMSGFVPNRTPSTQLGRVGTFYGQTVDEYKEQNMPQNVDTYFIPGSLRAFGPGRINRHFKFGGPASSLDTACSSSSVALNTACNSVWDGECDTAVAGGINILSASDNFVGLSAGQFLSQTGSCKTFDDAADGYCRAEAVVSVVIKRLDAAQADNDNILGVIRSCSTNYSADAVSITRPHGPTQERLYEKVLADAGIRPFDVDYIEMHGTGTQAGDACEMTSVTNVFAPAEPARPKDNPLFVGAIKSNIGHGEAASGAASLVKALLVLRENKIPPHVGIKGKLNHTFPDLNERNLVIPREATTLPSRDKKRRVLVNNFGAAGGNTAMVLEEADKPSADDFAVPDMRTNHVINISAKTTNSLKSNVRSLVDYLDTNLNVSLSDLSYTTTARRMHHPLRVSIVASTATQLKAALDSSVPVDNFKAPAKISKIAFAFTGQGAVYCSLGKELFATNSVFQGSLLRLDEMARSFGFSSFLPIIDGSSDDIASFSAVQTHLAINAVQISLCRLWASLGVTPGTVIGHSLGEYAALYASGVLSANDAIYLVGKRAQILEATCTRDTYAMLAVNTSVSEVGGLLQSRNLEIACINGPNDTVLSGLVENITAAHAELKAAGTKCVLLSLPYGFHSAQVEPILEPFEKVASGVTFNKPTVPVISPLLTKIVDEDGTFDAKYLAKHAREAVNFSSALQLARETNVIDGDSLWIEIGPHPLCLGMVQASLGARPRSIASLRKTENSGTAFAKAVSSAFTFGVDVDWSDYHRDYERGQKLLVLPSYSFDEKNFWMDYENDWMLNKGLQASSQKEDPTKKEAGPATTSVQRLLSQNIQDDGKVSMLFESDLAEPDLHSAIVGHLVNGSGLCPASIYADIALTIGKFVADNNDVPMPTAGMDVSDMVITHPIVVTKTRPTEPKLLHVKVDGDLNEGVLDIAFGHHRPEAKQTDWKANCKLRYGDGDKWKQQWSRISYLFANRISDLERNVSEGKTHKLLQGMVYKLFSTCVDYDHKYQAMKEVLLDSESLESTAKLELYEGSEGGDYYCKPFWVDALVHLAGFVMNANDAVDTSRSVFISGGWGNMQFAEEVNPTLPYQVHTKMIYQSKNLVAGDVFVFQEGQVVAVISDLKFQQVPHAMLDVIIPPSGSKARAAAPAPAVARAPEPSPRSISMSRRASEMTFTKERVADKICSVVAGEVGIPVEEVMEINSFDEMGVDSLLSLQIVSVLGDALGLELDSALFQTLRTVTELQDHLGNQDGDKDVEKDASDRSETSSVTEGASTKVTTPVASLQDERAMVLSSTIAQQLGVEEQDLQDASDLQELGLDSLMSLSILAILREKLGVDLQPDALIGATTLAAIQKLLGIGSTLKQPPAPAVKFVEDVNESVAVKKLGKPAPTLSVVLQGKPNTADRTAFFLPDGSGSAAVYAHLPPIAPKSLCVIGLQSPFARDAGEYACTLETIAGMWVDEIQRRQPKGPYILAGYSAGGYYAFEAAKQLQQRGEKIERLVIIDSPCRAKYEPMPNALIDWLGNKGILGGGDTGSKQHAQVARHFEATVKAVDRYKPEAMRPENVPPVTIIFANEGVVSESNPDIPEGITMANVTEWLLKRSPTKTASDGWETLLPGQQIECRNVPGHHFNLLSPQHGGSLSQTLAQVM